MIKTNELNALSVEARIEYAHSLVDLVDGTSKTQQKLLKTLGRIYVSALVKNQVGEALEAIYKIKSSK